MALILKKEGNANVTTPPDGSGAIFLSDADAITVKSSTGNVSSILTFTADTNTEVFFNDAGELGQSNTFTFDKTGGNLTVGGILASNYYDANGNPLDFERPAGDTTQIQFNDNGDFGASPNLTFNNGNSFLAVQGTVSANLLDGTLVTQNQPNITSVGTLTSLTVTGDVDAGNVTGTLLTGTLVTSAQPNITSVGTLDSLSVTGNVSAGNVSGTLLTGTLVTSAQPNITSVGTLSSLDVTGNVSAGNVSGTLLTGTLVTSAQPNITSVGTLDSLNVTGSIDSNGDLSVDGNAIVGGNLVVNGNLTYVNVEEFNVEDPIISVGGGPNGDPLTSDDGKDRGLLLHYYDTVPIDAFMGWDDSNAEFAFANSVSVANETVSINTLGNVRLDTLIGNVSGESATLSGDLSGNTANFSGNVVLPNLTVNNELSGNTANFSGNVDAANLTVSNELSVNTANFSGNIVAPNLTVNNELSGNTANFSGNVVLPNLTVNNELSGNTANFAGELSGNTANFSGSITSVDADLGNTVTANFFTGQLTFAAQPNITSVGTLTSVQIGATANTSDFPNAKAIASQDNTGDTNSVLAGLVGEAAADEANSSVLAVGLYGVGKTNGNVKATGVQGQALVTSTADLAPAVGVRGYSIDTHVDGYNIGVLGNAMNSGVGNYAFYVQNGGIGSIETETFWDLADNSNAALTFHSTGKANIFGIETTDNAEGIFTTGYLNVTGNATVGGVVTDNYYYANGAPVDFEQPAGANNQIQFNDDGSFGASANLEFDPATNELSVTGTLSVSGNANVGNIGATNGVFTTVAGTLTTAAQPNITSVGTLTSLDVTGNVSAGNVSGTLLTGTLTTASQPNVTSVGTLTGLDVSGDITAVNITANTGLFTGDAGGLSNIVGANVTGEVSFAATANAVAGGNVSGQVGNALVAGTVYTAAQPNITSVGTLTSLSVSGNASAGNIDGGNLVSANFVGGTLTTASQPNITSIGTLSSLSVSANVLAGNVYANSGTIGASSLAGTLTTAAQPNITSVGTLTSLGASGNITAPNLIANTNVVTDNIVNKSGNLSFTANSNVNFSITGGGVIDVGNTRITDVATPTSDSDAVTKLYVDNLVSAGIHFHEPVRVESPVNLTGTYDNGTDGVGATLTNSGANAALTIDGVTLSTSDRVLLYQQTDKTENGVYVVTTVGDGSTAWVLTRATDADSYSPGDNTGLDEGSYFFVREGNTGAGESYVVSTVGTITFGTTEIEFAQFSESQVYSAGTGLTLANLAFSIANTAVTSGSYGDGDSVATFTVNSQGQLTAASNVAITANAANLTGTTLNSSIVTSSLTSVGTLTGLTLASNANIALSGTASEVSGANLVSASFLAGTLTTAAQPNITSVGTLSSLSVTGNANIGNVGATNFVGSGASLTSLNASNISSGTLDQGRLANSSLTVNGVEIALGNSEVITANTTQTLTRGTYLTGSNFNGGTATTWAVDATTTNTASKVVARDANGSFSANVITATLSGSATSATTAGTVTTAAQPNITSVGTLSSLAISGTNNLTVRSITTGANTTTGTITGNWSLTAGSRLNATYADLAECYTADRDYEPGTVVVFGGSAEVTDHGVEDDRAVAGVVSTNPAYLMNAECEGEHVVQLALIGRVPCKVVGPISKGDLIVTSDKPGFAKANNDARTGSIIGKALEDFDGEGEGLIEVLVGRC